MFFVKRTSTCIQDGMFCKKGDVNTFLIGKTLCIDAHQRPAVLDDGYVYRLCAERELLKNKKIDKNFNNNYWFHSYEVVEINENTTNI